MQDQRKRAKAKNRVSFLLFNYNLVSREPMNTTASPTLYRTFIPWFTRSSYRSNIVRMQGIYFRVHGIRNRDTLFMGFLLHRWNENRTRPSTKKHLVIDLILHERKKMCYKRTHRQRAAIGWRSGEDRDRCGKCCRNRGAGTTCIAPFIFIQYNQPLATIFESGTSDLLNPVKNGVRVKTSK